MIIVIFYNLWVYIVLSFSVLSVFSVVKSRIAVSWRISAPFLWAASRCAGEEPVADQASEEFSMSEVGLMADNRQNDALGPR